MKPIRVILNPAAGHGNGARLLPSIEAALTRHGLDYDLVCTDSPGHAIELTSQAVQDGVDLIVAAGGDGTLNEVVNGLMRSKLTSRNQPSGSYARVGETIFQGPLVFRRTSIRAASYLNSVRAVCWILAGSLVEFILKGVISLTALAWALMQSVPSRQPNFLSGVDFLVS